MGFPKCCLGSRLQNDDLALYTFALQAQFHTQPGFFYFLTLRVWKGLKRYYPAVLAIVFNQE
jgi:hypothetical protein